MKTVVLTLTNDEANSLAFAAEWYAAGNSGYRPPQDERARWRAIAADLYVRCGAPLAQELRICLRPAGHDGAHGTNPDAVGNTEATA